MPELIDTLRGIVGATHVADAEADMAASLTDWRGRYRGRALAVVRPGSTAEVAAVVAACAAADVPMVPQGGNTGLCGGATPLGDGRAVVVSLARMKRVRAIDADNGTLTVEAGCTLDEVQAAAEGARRLPGFHPATSWMLNSPSCAGTARRARAKACHPPTHIR